MYVKLFEDFISESILSDHFVKRVSNRIQEASFFSVGDYKKNPATALERCKKVLTSKLKLLEKKSYVGDSIYWIENFGEIVLKDSKGSYDAVFSTDKGKYKGKMFIAIVFNNLLLTTYLVNGDKSVEEIKEMVKEHANKKYPEYARKFRGVEHSWLGGQKTIIDMDLSDEAFEIKINPAPVKTEVIMTKQVKEMTLTKGNEMTYIAKDENNEVYRRKTIAEVTFPDKKVMLVKFTDNNVKKFVIGGEKIQKKFVITPSKMSDDQFYIGDILEFGVRAGKNFVKISVSQTLRDLDVNTPPVG